MVIYPAVTVMAERPSAMLYASGSVTVNGTPISKSTSVFAGDRVATSAASVVSIDRAGSSIVVDPNSSVEYESNGFTMVHGTARVAMPSGMTAHAGPVDITAKAKSAKFDVQTDGTTVLIASREGALDLSDGTSTTTLEPGYTAKVTSQDQDQGPKPAATTEGDRRKRKKALIIILVSAAAAAIILCLIVCDNDKRAATPITP